MDNKKHPAGGDLPLNFYDDQQFKVEVSDQVFKTAQDIAEHNLEAAERKFDVSVNLLPAAEQRSELSPRRGFREPWVRLNRLAEPTES
jgi:hypothetical protein